MRLKVMSVVVRHRGRHYDGRFIVSNPHSDFRLAHVHAPHGANPANEFGRVQTIDDRFGTNWSRWFSICTFDDENKPLRAISTCEMRG